MSYTSRSLLPPYLVASVLGVLAFAVSLLAFHQGGFMLQSLGAFAGLVSVCTVAVLIYLNHLSYIAGDGMDQPIAARPIASDKAKPRD